MVRIRRWFSENVSFGRKYLKTTEKQFVADVLRESRQLMRQQFYSYFWDKTLHCKESGVSSERLCGEEVVVSLTSYGNRIHDVHLAIESIMQQSLKPNRIVLWLAEDEFKGKPLPVALQMQQERGLEIAYCEDLKSFNKLIHSLKAFPQSCIITIDDDSAYKPDVVEKMVNAHKTHSTEICANSMREVKYEKDGGLQPYKDWPHSVNKCPDNNMLAFFLGVGGVLYPPHCFTDEVFNKELFVAKCGKQDDVWFNAMRLLNSVKVIKVYTSNPTGDFVPLPATELDPLSKNNLYRGENDSVISAVYGHYGLLEKMMNN